MSNTTVLNRFFLVSQHPPPTLKQKRSFPPLDLRYPKPPSPGPYALPYPLRSTQQKGAISKRISRSRAMINRFPHLHISIPTSPRPCPDPRISQTETASSCDADPGRGVGGVGGGGAKSDVDWTWWSCEPDRGGLGVEKQTEGGGWAAP